jgi:hypothetical protein
VAALQHPGCAGACRTGDPAGPSGEGCGTPWHTPPTSVHSAPNVPTGRPGTERAEVEQAFAVSPSQPTDSVCLRRESMAPGVALLPVAACKASERTYVGMSKAVEFDRSLATGSRSCCLRCGEAGAARERTKGENHCGEFALDRTRRIVRASRLFMWSFHRKQT